MSQFPPFFLEREPDNPRNTPQYRESQDIAQNDQFGGQIAAYGSSVRSKPYIGNITLQDQIRNTKIVQNSLATADQNTPYQFLNLSPDTKNEFLDIPSFLVYPQELGLNNRYKHFVVFNIYQGTSDEVRLASRQANTESSLILAAGGVQFGIGADKTEIRRILQNSLGNQGYSDAQLTAMTDRVAQLYTGGGTGAIDGITTDARIGAFDKAITDLFVNYGNASKDDQGAIDNFLSGLSAVVGSAGEDRKSVV